MRVLVTRPEPQASAWTTLLVDRGLDALALPLLAIQPPPDSQVVTQAWRAIASFSGLMFVSPAAVQAWVQARPDAAGWPLHVWAAAPGPATAKQLAAIGVAQVLAPAADAEQFDSDALWAQIGSRDWREQRILIVNGGAGREDMARRWTQAGAVVDKVQAYARGDAVWSGAQLQAYSAAMRAPRACAWLFSSSDAVARLEAREQALRSADRDHAADAARAPDADHAPPVDADRGVASNTWAQHRALCTHPAIAERASRAGFGRVAACRPVMDAIADALVTMRDDAEERNAPRAAPP